MKSFVVLLSVCFASEAAVAQVLLPHRAVYSIGLARDSAIDQLSEVRGAYVLEWQAECDGWVSNQRMLFVGLTSEGMPLQQDVSFSSFEGSDGTTFRFTSTARTNGVASESFSGRARLAETSDGGEVAFDDPANVTLDLPAGAVFPTTHLVELLAAAQAGDHFRRHLLFDGSGVEDGLSEVSTVIGQPRKVPEESDGSVRWPVTLAYFSHAGSDLSPEFELRGLLSEGGILHDVVLDYGDFALEGRLEKLEVLDAPVCR